MIRDKAAITGKVTAIVFGPDGKVKRFDRSWWRKLLGLPGREMIIVNHNIVTNLGDALIVDMLSTTSARDPVDNTDGVIGVGTGYVSALKTTTALVAQTGSNEAMDATYPQQKGSWTTADDNVIVYRSSFEAGDLVATGIDEAALGNGTELLAYAALSPAANMTALDTLQVTWELTILGS